MAKKCYYGTKECSGKTWQCVSCQEQYCEFHFHQTDLGYNTECVLCERERKDSIKRWLDCIVFVPSLFELNTQNDEPTGEVRHFCSTKCRDEYSVEPQAEFLAWMKGTHTEITHDEKCATCDKILDDVLFDNGFARDVNQSTVLPDKVLEYLNDIWGPGIVTAHDITSETAQALLDNAQDDVPVNEHLYDKLAFNAFASLHKLPPWDKISQGQFAEFAKSKS